MADKKRRLFSRREYLNDFHRNIKGEYYYTGQMFAFDGNKAAYSQYITYIITDAVLILLFTAAAECFPSVEMSRYPLTALFWMFQLTASCVLIYSAVRIALRKNPLRAYIYKATAQNLHVKAAAAGICSCLSALEMIIFLAIKGINGELWQNIIRPGLSLSSAYMAYRLYAYLKTVSWKEIPNDGNVKVAPAEMPKL